MTQPILITFSDEPLVKDAPRQAVIDIAPYLATPVHSNTAYAGQWVGALLPSEENPYDFLGEVELGGLVEWAKTAGGSQNTEFYGLAMQIAGLNSAQPGASERYNLLPKAMCMDAKSLREFAIESLSVKTIAEVNVMVDLAPLGSSPARERPSA